MLNRIVTAQEPIAIGCDAPKKRAANYDPHVTFNGTFEDMIAISTTGAGAKKKASKK